MGVGGRVGVGAVVRAGVIGPVPAEVVDPAGVVDPRGADVEAAGCAVGCVCDEVTGALRVGTVFRFVVCASDDGVKASERVRTKRLARGLVFAGGFITERVNRTALVY